MFKNPLVSVKWLFENLELPNLVILDASPKKNVSNLVPEFLDIQIKGARIFDMESTFVDTRSDLPNMMPTPEIFTLNCQKLGINKSSLIVVYDNLGIYTSPRAWWMFKSMGHKDVAILDGGLPAWKKEELPCLPIQNLAVKKGNFIAKYRSDNIKKSDEILNNLNTPDIQIIDARSAVRFQGRSPEPRKNMESGHIPNSINLPFQEVLNQGMMKEDSELKSIFESLNIENKQLVFSCGSGITACIVLLASEIVTSNVNSMYDGSWSEWGQHGKFPVEK